MASLFPNGIKGLADTKWSGVAGSAAKLVGIDYRSKPGIITAHQKLTKNSGSTVDELCKVGIAVSDGSTLWFSSTSGKIWREVAGTWTLVFTLVINAYDLLTATFIGSESVLDKTNQPIIAMSSDGFHMFVAGLSSNDIYSYTLSTAFDIETATYVETIGSSEVAAIAGMFVRDDGLKMYLRSSSAVYQYTLSSAWDLSTATYDTVTFNMSAQVTSGVGIWFKSDGTIMYAKNGTSGGTVYQYTVATPWNVSTASYASLSYTFANGTTFENSISLNSTGTKLYLCSASGVVGTLQYTLATPWNISTATYDSVVLPKAAWSTVGPMSVVVIGAHVYVSTVNDGEVLQYGTAAGTEEVKGLSGREFNSNIYWATEFYLFKIAVADLASWATKVSAAGRFVNGERTYHPMTVQNLQLFIGDKVVMAKVNELSQFIAETELNVQVSETITSVISFDIDILIGTKDVNQCRVIRWDTVSESWGAEDVINDVEVYAFIRDDNYVYAQVGDAGRMYYYNGEKLIPYQRMPGTWNPSSKGKINANAVGFILGVPVFGYSNITGNPTEQGIYGFGSYSKDYPKTLSLDFPLSTGVFADIEIGAVLTKGSDMWVSWKSGSSPTYGVDKLDYSAKYASAYLETVMLSPVKNRTEFKTIARVQAPYASLPASTAVVLGYKKNYAANYATLTSVVDAKHATVKADKSVPEIGNVQLRMGLTVNGNDAPELEDLQLDFVAETTQTT